MALGSSVYKLTFDSNAAEVLTPTRREIALSKRIMEETATSSEKYAASTAILDRQLTKGLITEEQHKRALEQIQSELPENIAKTRQLAEAEDRYNREMKEGRTLTRSLMTAEEKRNEELAKSRRLLRQGVISQDTYNRQLAKTRMEQMRSIPIVGSLSSRFAGIHPAAIAASVGLAGLAVGMRVAVGVAGTLTREVSQQFQEMDKLAKSARKLGDTVDNLFIMGQAAAELSGMNFGQFETAMQRMTRRVAEAAAGTGEAKKAIEELGLDANALNMAGPTGAMEMFADAFMEIESPADRLRLAFKLFDAEGAKLVTTFEGGSVGLRKYRAEMEDLGAVPSPFDAAAIEPMNDALRRVGLVIDGITRDLATEVAPVITAVAESLIDALKPGSSLGDDIRVSLETIPPLIAMAADQTNKWIGMFQLAQAEAMQTGATILNAAAAIDRASAAISPFKEVNQDLQAIADDFQRQINVRTGKAVQRIADGTAGSIQQRVEEIRREIAEAARAGEDGGRIDEEAVATEESSKLQASIDQVTAALELQIDTYGMTSAEVERYKLAQAGANDEQLRTVEYLQELAAANDAAAEAERKRDETEKQAIATQEQIASSIQNAKDELQLQLDTYGMTSNEIERYKLAQAGATDADLMQISILQDLIAAKEKKSEADKLATEQAKQLADDIESYTAELEKQIATVGMSADEVKRWELAQRGATEEEIKKIKALQDEAGATDALTAAMNRSYDAMDVGERKTLEGLAKARELAASRSVSPINVAGAEAPLTDGGFNNAVPFEMIPPEATTISGPPASSFSMTPPVAQPIVPQPSKDSEELKKQTELQKKIAKNTAKPKPLQIEEVTL